MSDYNDKLVGDILYQSRLRSRLLAGVIIILIGGILINAFVYNDEFLGVYADTFYLYLCLGLLAMLAIRGFLVSFAIQHFFKKLGKVPLHFRFFNILFEIAVPSVVIALMAGQANPLNILLSPLVEIYFLFLLLSVLEMDFRLSFFAGFLAASAYFGISLYYLEDIQAPDDLPFFSIPLFYFGRSLLLLISGILAGIAGMLIRKRALAIYEEREQKDHIRQLFGQQLSEEVAQELINPQENMEGKRLQVCVMFLDIRGFTPMTADMDPQEIIALQNFIFPFMIDIVSKHHGIINQLLGDGFMATFGAPVSIGNDCQFAVEASLEILDELEKRNSREENPPVHVGIGLHSGTVVTGNVGSNVRKQYSITGQTVIVASRVEQLNKQYKSSLLITSEVEKSLDGLASNAKSLGPSDIKGLDSPIELFQLR